MDKFINVALLSAILMLMLVLAAGWCIATEPPEVEYVTVQHCITYPTEDGALRKTCVTEKREKEVEDDR